MKRTMGEREHAGVHLDCEVCKEKSVAVIPPQHAPFGIVDCPRCGATYLVSLEPREEAGQHPDAPTA